MSNETDFLIHLRSMNRKRQTYWDGYDQIDGMYKSNEFGNEAGEVMGAVKKLYRHDLGIAGNTTKSREELFTDLEDEIGDAIISLDMLADYYGIDIEKAAKSKFNKTSDKVGIEVKFDD